VTGNSYDVMKGPNNSQIGGSRNDLFGGQKFGEADNSKIGQILTDQSNLDHMFT
jgi:hypothetical protein